MEDKLLKTRLYHERPMVPGALGALVGALLAARLPGWALWVFGAAALLLGVLLLMRERTWFALPLFLGLLLLRGGLLPGVIVRPGTYSVTGTLIASPERDRGKTQAVLGRLALNGRRVPGAMELTLPFDADLAYGDALSLSAQVVPDGRGAVRGLSTVLYLGTGEGEVKVSPGRKSRIFGLALSWRARLEAVADDLFGPFSGPAKGMLLGDKSDVNYLTFAAYRRSGMLHLLAVSGLHLGVVCGALLRLIRGRKKWLRLGLSAALLLLFCLLTGLAPASLRAAVMLLCFRFAHLLDRQDDPLSSLGAAMTLLLLVNPRLLTAPGFGLSFGAVMGLICLTTPCMDLLRCPRGGLGEQLARAVAAFLGTMPLIASMEGEVQWLGIPASLLALPAAPLFLIPGWLALLLFLLWPGGGRVLALVPRGVLLYFEGLSQLVPTEGVTLPPANGLALILWFAGMLFASEYWLPNARRPAWLGWGLLMAGALVWFLV